LGTPIGKVEIRERTVSNETQRTTRVPREKDAGAEWAQTGLAVKEFGET